jgi:membrane-bound metal-dependent hydrolase YbcI (DUF457 family)
LDNATHTLFAVTLARTPLGRAGRGTLAALVIASNAPDIDIVAAARGSASYLAWHRGPTHGPFGIVGLGVLTATIVWQVRRFLDRRLGVTDHRARARIPPMGTRAGPEENAGFGMLISVSMIGVLLHVLMDLPTSYGTRLLSPFDWRWFAVDWLPIIDIYLLMTLMVGLVFAEVTKASRRRIASIVLMLMGANYGVRAVAHHQALTLAPRLFGPHLPPPCHPPRAAPAIDYWPRAGAAPAAAGQPCLVEIAAVPTFASPFHWRVIAHLSNAYELHEVNVLDRRLQQPGGGAETFWRRAVRYPNLWTPAATIAAATRTGQAFLGFSRFPATRSFVDPAGVATVRWNDMRFTGGVYSLGDRRPDPFSVVVRIGPDGRILEERIGR